MIFLDGNHSMYKCSLCEESGTGERWCCQECRDDYCFLCVAREVAEEGKQTVLKLNEFRSYSPSLAYCQEVVHRLARVNMR